MTEALATIVYERKSGLTTAGEFTGRLVDIRAIVKIDKLMRHRYPDNFMRPMCIVRLKEWKK